MLFTFSSCTICTTYINLRYQSTLQFDSRQNMSNIHLQTSFLPEGTHTHTSILKKTKIFCTQNRKVPPSLLPPAAQGGENHFLLQRWKRGFLENVMSCCQHLLFPRWGRNSDMQPGPKATTREDQSLSSCQILNRVVNFIYFK